MFIQGIHQALKGLTGVPVVKVLVKNYSPILKSLYTKITIIY